MADVYYVLRTRHGNRYYTGGLLTESTDITRAQEYPLPVRVSSADNAQWETCAVMPDGTVIPLTE